MRRPPPIPTGTDTLFPSTTLFRSDRQAHPPPCPEMRRRRGLPHAGASARRRWGTGPAARHVQAPLREERRRCPRQAQRKSPASLLEGRSEEHTSELQSLMRISYAVFCLKTKKTKIIQ